MMLIFNVCVAILDSIYQQFYQSRFGYKSSPDYSKVFLYFVHYNHRFFVFK